MEEILRVSRYRGTAQPGVLDGRPELANLVQLAGLPASNRGLEFLVDRGLERVADPVLQEVGRAGLRRPPYTAENLEDRLNDAAQVLAARRREQLAGDLLRSDAAVTPLSLRTMQRRYRQLAAELAPVLRDLAPRTAPHEGVVGEERPIPGDRSEFLGDITIPDGTLMRPGESAVKTWALRNAGVVPWTGRWLARVGGTVSRNTVMTPTRVRIPDTQPGDQATISVPITAPELAGTYEIHWKMADDSGRLYFPDRYWIGVQFSIVVPGTH